MAEFLVKVATEQGHLVQQVEHGYSEAEVRDRYIQQGYLVYWVKPRSLLTAGGMSLGRRTKLKSSSFLIFNQQFLTLIKAGLPILTSLDLLIKRQRDQYLLQLLENVRDRVKGGELLSDAFAAQHVFPKMYTTTLMAGEKSGNMEEVLSRYIAYQRLVQTFRKKLAVSLVYPALLVSVVTVMLIFLITYVIPKFADLFNNMGAQLPAITVFMLAVGVNAQKYAWIVILVLLAAAILTWRWKQSDRGAERIDQFLFSLPLVGEIRLKYQVANFSRILATLLQGGLPLVSAHGDGRRFHEQPPDAERHPHRDRARARRPGPGEQPGNRKDLSRSRGRNGRGRRIHRSLAGDAQLGGRVLRRRCADGHGRGDGADRAGHPDRHGGVCRRDPDLPLHADLYFGSRRALIWLGL